ncbi:PREDICTED: uncharacterized protein LOC109465527 [Branchiostoma belcheri]|uniref:Uncharacterized protein LOC109465527 n=1 Tax=Branchiostoma belcheri TaxID=7741 RepID=A0A6P4YI60_BRABE|nr:PREDICTED: uncharacterized protein LOC109465527 [Branchiostoma belcheri]
MHGWMYNDAGNNPRIDGCHCLSCMLAAVADGVVLAEVECLPGPKDGLPPGVYGVYLSWRDGIQIPDVKHKKQKKQPISKKGKPMKTRKRQGDPSEVESDEEAMLKDNGVNDNDAASNDDGGAAAAGDQQPRCGESDLPRVKRPRSNCIKCKFSPVFKTVYNPEIWTDQKLKETLKEAFQNYLKDSANLDHLQYNEDVHWTGPFEIDGNTYQLEGYFEVQKCGSRERKITDLDSVLIRETPIIFRRMGRE